MSDLEKQYNKIVETFEKNVSDEKQVKKVKKQLDKLIDIAIEDFSNVLDNYDEKMNLLEKQSRNNEERIKVLEEKLKLFEKMIEMDDYDFFITCPYCGFEFQTDYDEEITEICCPECNQTFDIDWGDSEEK